MISLESFATQIIHSLIHPSVKATSKDKMGGGKRMEILLPDSALTSWVSEPEIQKVM